MALVIDVLQCIHMVLFFPLLCAVCYILVHLLASTFPLPSLRYVVLVSMIFDTFLVPRSDGRAYVRVFPRRVDPSPLDPNVPAP